MRVLIGAISGEPGETLTLQVRLESSAAVSAVATVFEFDAAAPVLADGEGLPQCSSPLAAEEVSFVFVPDGCEPQADCSGVEATILGTDEAIADGAVIFTCMVGIAGDAEAGLLPLPCVSAVATGPSEIDLEASCVSGSVEVLALATPSPTAATPAPPTERPSATATRRHGSDEDDGCQIAAAANGAGLWLLIPVPAGWAFRRRRACAADGAVPRRSGANRFQSRGAETRRSVWIYRADEPRRRDSRMKRKRGNAKAKATAKVSRT